MSSDKPKSPESGGTNPRALMRPLVRFFVRNPLFCDLLSLAVILMGVLALFSIRREVFPNVSFDFINVSTLFPGASPEEVEKFVTNPIEQDLQEVDGIEKIFSGSIENASQIFLQLDPDETNGKKAKDDIQAVIDRVADLPDDIEDPMVTELQSKDQPILEIVLAGDLPPLELREIARKLERDVEKVDGVARVAHVGLRDREIRVEVSLAKLNAYRLSLEDVTRALKGQNLSVPGGTTEPVGVNATEKEKLVRTVGIFQTLDDVKNTVIRANDIGQSVTVGQVASVYYDLEKADVLNRANGAPSQTLTVLMKEKADAINLVREVRKVVEEKRPALGEGVKISFVNDMSEYIERRVSILTGNMMIGLLLVVLLLPLMIPFKFSLIVAMGEPFAFLGAILVLALIGSSINLISMVGLIIVSGILVDDSIVVTENAVRLIEEEGMDPEEAAVEGTLQIMGPVSASVATTSLAFLPMMFMTGIFGKFVREIPVAVLVCLAASLFETYFILPGHIAHWIKKKDARPPSNGSRVKRFLESTRTAWDRFVEPAYIAFLDRALKRRYLVVGVFAALFFATVGLVAGVMKVVMFPADGIEIFFVRAEAAHGSSLDATLHYVKPLEAMVAKLPKEELNDFITTVGLAQQEPNDPNRKKGSEYAQIAVYLSPESARTRTAAQIIEALRQEMGQPEGIVKLTFERVAGGPPQGKPVSLGVRGEDYPQILEAVKDLKAFVAKIDGVTDVAESYAPGKEELLVKIDPSQASAAGLSVAAIGSTVRAAYAGIVATSVKGLDEEIDVRVSLPKTERATSELLPDLLIPNQMGNLVTLGRVAKIENSRGIASYEHEDNRRQVKVTAEVNTDKISAIEANAKVREYLPELRKKHPSIEVEFGGEDKDTQESFQSLFRAFGAAMIGIFLVLVLTFRGILQPLTILITVPLGFIAVMWAFFVHGMPITFMGCLGILALSGTIVNNAIVFIDFVNQARAQGMEKMKSIHEAAATRLRPIFLTTVTTVIGVMPTAYGLGGEDKFVEPIAMALGWGLLFGSILTAFVFPSALAILDDFQDWLGRRFPRIANFYE